MLADGIERDIPRQCVTIRPGVNPIRSHGEIF